MSVKMIMYFAWAWVICTLVCLFIEGGYFGDTEINIINQLTGYNTLELGGIWGIPRIIIGFFTHGFPKLITWDYSFFEGTWALIRIILIAVLSVGAIWGLVQLFIPIFQRNL